MSNGPAQNIFFSSLAVITEGLTIQSTIIARDEAGCKREGEGGFVKCLLRDFWPYFLFWYIIPHRLHP